MATHFSPAVTGAPLFHVFAVREKLGTYRFFYFPALHVSRDTLRAGAEAVTPLVARWTWKA